MYNGLSAALVLLALCPAGALAATAGAGSHIGPGHGSSGAAKTAAPRPASSQNAAVVLAEVDTSVITAAELDARIAIPTTVMHARNSDERRALARAALEQEIQNRIALIEFKRRGLSQDPRYLTTLRIHQDQQLADAYVRATYEKKFVPTEAEIKEKLPGSWSRIKLSAIYFQEREAAEKAHPEIAANAARFEEMAAKHSALESQKPHGGEYLLQGTGLFLPAEEKLLFSLKKGEISPVLDLQIMYGIYKLVDRQEVPAAERELLRQGVVKSLSEKKLNQHVGEITKLHTYEIRAASLLQAAEEMVAFRGGNAVVVAVLDGDEVTFGDLRNAQVRPPELFYSEVTASSMNSAYRGYLERVMLTRTIAAEAREEGFVMPAAPGGDPMLWTILTRRLGAEIFKGLSVSEQEVRAYYDANLPMFSRTEMYSVQKMQFSTRELAEIARKRVVDDPSLFPKIREAMSEDPFEERHGGQKTYNEEFTNRTAAYRDAVRATPVGKVTPVVELDGKFLLLKVEDIVKGYVFPYESVRWDISSRVLGAKQSVVLTKFIDDLRAAAKVVIHEERLAAYLKEMR